MMLINLHNWFKLSVIFMIWHCARKMDFRNIRGTTSDRKVISTHTLLLDLGEQVAFQLPALHSLMGCDTVCKVSTKNSALKQLPWAYYQCKLRIPWAYHPSIKLCILWAYYQCKLRILWSYHLRLNYVYYGHIIFV